MNGTSRTASIREFQRYVDLQDMQNVLRYGSSAPRFAERIWVDPMACNHRIKGGRFDRRHSGQVIDGNWDSDRAPVETSKKVRFCILHWEQGVPWEETGVYEHMLNLIERHGGPVDGCATLDDIVARYERKDEMFEQVRQEGRLRSKDELPEQSFREMGGVYMHVDRHGLPLFAGGGIHRFAITRMLGLRRIPAQVGVVHPRAIPRWRKKLLAEP